MIGNISAELCLELSPTKPESPPSLRTGKAIWAGSHFKRRCPLQAPPFPALHSCCRASTDLLQQAGVTEWLEETGGGGAVGRAMQTEQQHVNITKLTYPDPKIHPSLIAHHSNSTWCEQSDSTLLYSLPRGIDHTDQKPSPIHIHSKSRFVHI